LFEVHLVIPAPLRVPEPQIQLRVVGVEGQPLAHDSKQAYRQESDRR
jgi:hypothetical protein